ncbi:MAG TPA: GNAT family N-acetyltransferase [Longimicrobiaceae bacterium]|nr:GNAT family N-acetyltransferase [Longimicrobiaceae bacterium]
MNPEPESPGVRCGVLRAADVEETTALIAATFSRAEPMGAALGLPPEVVRQVVSVFAPRAVEDGLTLVARDAATGELVGALLADDFAAPPPEGMEAVSERFRPIAALLEELDAGYREGRSIRRGEYLHLAMLGVSPAAAGRRVGQELVELCMENGARRGFRTAVTEATGRVSQHICRKHGFVERITCPYRSFRFEGRPVFAGIGDHHGAVLMDRPLQAGG